MTQWRRWHLRQQTTHSLCLAAPTCWVPTCWLGSSFPFPGSPALGKLQSRSFHPSLVLPGAQSLSASLRLTVFSNPEQIRRCSQGREAPHQFSSKPPWERGAPEIHQPLGPSGLCSPLDSRCPRNPRLARVHRCLSPPPALAVLLVAAPLSWLV